VWSAEECQNLEAVYGLRNTVTRKLQHTKKTECQVLYDLNSRGNLHYSGANQT
jgi:hypothetical protein